MHPDRAKKDQVERQSKREHMPETGQRIGYPPNRRGQMPPLGLCEHPGGRFDGDDFQAEIGEPRGIPAGPGANVQDTTRHRRKEVGKPVVDGLSRDDSSGWTRPEHDRRTSE